MEKVFFHVDLDAFFASVEQLDHPEYRGKPVIVGGKPGEPRGVVSTASYEARKFGVHSAMPTAIAYKLCPQGIYLHGNYKRYSEKSEEVMSILKNYSPDVQQMSIDEAFLDMTGTENLFGKPEDTARKLKKEIKEKTGLTVSVGIASNKYISKIASGLQKPDGLTLVPSGSEEKFMLELPLDKVWGVGKKTYERLMNLQLRTTKEIHSRSLSILQNLMGTASGQFIYKAVRGLEAETFISETKNHSVSAENTYETDLTYDEQFEYALLELSQVVFFRILKEKVKSKTVHLKIRYEDFTTVSIQETFGSYVSSSDDLYSKIKKLFARKYEQNHGIRLLGVGLSNVESTDAPVQGELFDFSEKNKAKVEEAILKATEKNPGIKITKASLLKKLSIIFAAGILFAASSRSYGQTVTENERKTDGASSIVFNTRNISPYFDRNATSLFNYNLDDNEIEFMANGWWQSSFSKSLTMTTGYGTETAAENQPSIFTQNVDLDLWLMINRHWYFETAFAEGFEKNTIAAGYTGENFVKDIRLANRGIIFPSTYSIDDAGKGIGGGNNSAPGVHLKFGNDNFNWDTVFRYDMVESYEKSWQGKNSISTDNIDLSDWFTGYKYALPKNTAAKIKDIYVEKYDGSFTKINHNYFLTQTSDSMDSDVLYLSQDAKTGIKNGRLPQVIVEFSERVNLGTWNDEHSFLGKVQKTFDQVKLENFAFDYGNGTARIKIQSPDGFSPFVYANMYDTGITPATDAKIASRTTETAITKYEVDLHKESSTFVSKDFINQNHIFATVYLSDSDSIENETLKRYPFASANPAVYLGYNSSDDYVLRLRTLTKINRLDIGSKAIPGTVKVYRNGSLDTSAKYNPESGTITLSGNINESDHIFAQWFEDSESTDTGSITFASGINFNIIQNLTGDFSVASRWNYNPSESFSTTQTSSPGSATIATKLKYDTQNFKVQNTAAISLEKADTTGTLRLLSMDNDRETFYLSKGSASNLPDSIVPVLTGFDEILQKENDCSQNAAKGKKDSSVSGYAVPFSWKFSSPQVSLNPNWAALTIATPGISSTLKTAASFSIAVKASDLPSDTKIYLQLGVLSKDDFSVESTYLPTWEITDQLTSGSSEWQTVIVSITDEQKSRINNGTSARFIATSPSVQAGTIYAGPYKTDGTLFNFEKNKDFEISLSTEQDSTLNDSKIKKLNSSKNYVQFFNYKTSSGGKLPQSQELKFFTYFDETDISLYKNAGIWIKKDSSLKKISLELVSPDKYGSFLTALKVDISEEQISLLADDTYYQLTVNFKEKTAKIGQISTPAYVSPKITASRLNVTLQADDSGSFAMDEFIFTDSVSSMDIQNITELEYRTSTKLFNTLKFASEVKESYSSSDNKDSKTIIETQNSLEVSAKNVHAQADFTTTTDGNPIPQGAHSLSVSKVFDIATFKESYSYDIENRSFAKNNNVILDFNKTFIPLLINLNSFNSMDTWSNIQNLKNEISFSRDYFSSKTAITLSQQNNTSTENFNNYFDAYKGITDFQFSAGSETNSKRNVNFNEALSFKIPLSDIKPQFTYDINQSYKNTSSVLYENSLSTSLFIPFNFNSNSFNLSWTKQGTSQENTFQKASYKEDIDYMFHNQNNINWYYKALPVADFTKDFVEQNNYNQVSYSSIYRLGWKRNFSATKYDFFIPVNAGFNFSRDITCSSSQTDLFQYQTFATFTAMNVFGKTGTVHLFDIFEQDSYISNFQASLKLPSNSLRQTSVLFSGYFLSDFRITSSDLIKNAFEASAEGSDQWNIKETLSYSRQVPWTLLSSIASLFSDTPSNEYISTRKDSLNLLFSRNEEFKKRTIQYLHSADVQINKYVTLNSDFELSYDATVDKIILLLASGSLGITVKF